jgi:hypothetical protein
MKIAWIRSPWWDCCWVLSGLPLGILLSAVPTALAFSRYPYDRFLLGIFIITVPLQVAHVASPLLAAWLNPGFRRVMLSRPTQFVLWPTIIFMVCIMIGVATQTGWTSYDFLHPDQMWRVTGLTNPFPLLCWVYWVWNLWHFGRQNYGVMRLYRIRRRLCWVAGFGGTILALTLLPFLASELGVSFAVMLLMTGMISANHWLTELAFTAQISRRPLPFLVGLVAFGCIGFMWTIATPKGAILQVIPLFLSPFLGLNLIHFLYDRWLYRFSDPAIRATITRAMFSAKTAQ